MLIPRKVKHRKQHHPRQRGIARAASNRNAVARARDTFARRGVAHKAIVEIDEEINEIRG